MDPGAAGLGRVQSDATAFAHRDAEVFVVAAVMVPPGAPPERASQALAGWPAVAAAYPPPTYERLAAIKRHYDPGNVLRRNHNVRPA